MYPLVYWNLRSIASDLVPARHLETLHDWFQLNAHSCLAKSAELVHVLELLSSRGITCVGYKGPTLAMRVLGNVALREYRDIDIVVPGADARRARETLVSAGYSPPNQLSDAALDYVFSHLYSEVFRRDEGVFVELHWGFTNIDTRFPLDPGEVLAELGRVRMGRTAVPVFSDEDTLLFLSMHGAKHCWERFEWITSVGELIRGNPDLRWGSMLDRADRLGVGRSLLLAASLAAEIAETPLPRGVLRAAVADARVQQTAEGIVRRFEKPKRGSLPTRVTNAHRARLRIKLQSTRRERLRFLARRLVTCPTEEIGTVVRVGRHVVPLAAFVRPFRLARSATASGVTRVTGMVRQSLRSDNALE